MPGMIVSVIPAEAGIGLVMPGAIVSVIPAEAGIHSAATLPRAAVDCLSRA